MKKLHKDNNGYSLIELVVSLVVMVMVMGILGVFINMSSVSYRVVNRIQTLQAEAQISRDFITEVMLDAEDAGIDNVEYSGDKCIWIKRPGGSYGFVLWDSTEELLRYTESSTPLYIPGTTVFDYNTMFVELYHDPYSLLAENVCGVTMIKNVVEGATGQLVTITLSLRMTPSDPPEEIYKTTFKVVNRNAEK